LSTNSDLDIDFGTPLGLLVDMTLTFEDGDVCCGGNGNGTPGDDPNSFVSDGSGGAIITLWGANGYTSTSPTSGSYDNEGGPTTVGMDLRLQLSRVPEPTTVMLMGLGLLGLGFRRRIVSV